MLNTWNDFERTLNAMDVFRRQMDRVFEQVDASRPQNLDAHNMPRAVLWDRGAELVITAEVPGLSERDVKLTLLQDALTLEGARQIEAPAGYAVHRQERASLRFARTIALPARIDAERVTASVRDGVLTVTLPKAAEAQPRAITVRGESESESQASNGGAGNN